MGRGRNGGNKLEKKGGGGKVGQKARGGDWRMEITVSGRGKRKDQLWWRFLRCCQDLPVVHCMTAHWSVFSLISVNSYL